MTNAIKIFEPAEKKKAFDFYWKGETQWVRFNFKGKDYDMPTKDAEKLFLAAGCFFIFILFLSLLAEALKAQPK